MYFITKSPPNVLMKIIYRILGLQAIELQTQTVASKVIVPQFNIPLTSNLQPTVNLQKPFLDELFDRQIKIQKILGFEFDKMILEEKEQYTKDHCLYLLEEVHELLREINFKKHKKVRHPVSRDNIKDELSDILHFFVNLSLCWEVYPAELSTACLAKNDKNLQRISNPEY